MNLGYASTYSTRLSSVPYSPVLLRGDVIRPTAYAWLGMAPMQLPCQTVVYQISSNYPLELSRHGGIRTQISVATKYNLDIISTLSSHCISKGPKLCAPCGPDFLPPVDFSATLVSIILVSAVDACDSTAGLQESQSMVPDLSFIS